MVSEETDTGIFWQVIDGIPTMLRRNEMEKKNAAEKVVKAEKARAPRKTEGFAIFEKTDTDIFRQVIAGLPTMRDCEQWLKVHVQEMQNKSIIICHVKRRAVVSAEVREIVMLKME